MKEIMLYHGSENIVDKPIFNSPFANNENDYGSAFYCTNDKELAKEWSCRRGYVGFVNTYKFDIDGLKILNFTDKSKYSFLNWIAVLLHHKKAKEYIENMYQEELNFVKSYYIDINCFDVIIGYRADDAYFKFPMMFVEGYLSYKDMEKLYLNGELGIQIALKSKESFNRIKFIRYEETDEKYIMKFKKRLQKANQIYYEIEYKGRKSRKDKIRDLMKNDKRA